MRLLVIFFLLTFCMGCMFVSESYSPKDVGYRFEGSCVGLSWEKCNERAAVLCDEFGEAVATIENTGGPENKPGMAIIPKRIEVTCKAK